MKFLVLSVLGVWFLAMTVSCGSAPEVVSVERVGEPNISTVTRSCHKTGACFTCLPGFDGKMNCGFKLSPICPGRQKVTISEVPVIIHYKDGATKMSMHEEIIERGFCR